MNDNAQRDKSVRRVIIVEGMANLAVLIAKTVVGLSSGSLAILGDAVHSLTDLFNNMIAWVVMRISALPADREHPYGHRKFETLAVFVLATLLAVLAFELASHAFTREEAVITTSAWELGLMLMVLTTNIGLSLWQRRWAQRLESDILLADASHTFADVLTTVVIIAGWQLSSMGYVWLDKLCALGVAALVLYLSFKLFKRATPVLVDQFAVNPDQVSAIIKTIPGVHKVTRVRSRWIGSERAVDMIICVSPHLSTAQSHKIADRIEQLLEERFQVTDVSIHVEPFAPPSGRRSRKLD